MLTASGAVVDLPTDPMKVGATRLSNNTAEMSGMIEALLALLSWAQRRKHRRARSEVDLRAGDEVVCHVDSKYVIGMMQGLFAPRENVLMAKLLQHLATEVRRYMKLKVVWTTGHADDKGNAHADFLATRSMEQIELQWKRLPDEVDGNLQEFVTRTAGPISVVEVPLHECVAQCEKKAQSALFQRKRKMHEAREMRIPAAPTAERPATHLTIQDFTLAVAQAGGAARRTEGSRGTLNPTGGF